jgi:hypothetical protein
VTIQELQQNNFKIFGRQPKSISKSTSFAFNVNQLQKNRVQVLVQAFPLLSITLQLILPMQKIVPTKT